MDPTNVSMLPPCRYAGLDHALEFGSAALVGSAGLDTGLDQPVASRGGAERASLDGLATVRPPGRQAVMAQLAFCDQKSGRSSSTRSCVTLGVILPCSPRSKRTRP